MCTFTHMCVQLDYNKYALSFFHTSVPTLMRRLRRDTTKPSYVEPVSSLRLRVKCQITHQSRWSSFNQLVSTQRHHNNKNGIYLWQRNQIFQISSKSHNSGSDTTSRLINRQKPRWSPSSCWAPTLYQAPSKECLCPTGKVHLLLHCYKICLTTTYPNVT